VTGICLRLRFRRRLAHPPSKVWRALVEPERQKAWFPSTIEGAWVEGGALRLVFPFEDAPEMHGIRPRLRPAADARVQLG
jgi:uncharacterized protein YndB with AHSA1/START domain